MVYAATEGTLPVITADQLKSSIAVCLYAAECARWYAVSGDAAFKENAFRSLNWVTYCNESDGQAVESPLSKDENDDKRRFFAFCYH
jgi:hypothetical protein